MAVTRHWRYKPKQSFSDRWFYRLWWALVVIWIGSTLLMCMKAFT